jgi:hypothetical protein
MISWTPELDSRLLKIVDSNISVALGLRRASEQLNHLEDTEDFTVHACRNRWYSDSLKTLRGLDPSEDGRSRNKGGSTTYKAGGESFTQTSTTNDTSPTTTTNTSTNTLIPTSEELRQNIHLIKSEENAMTTEETFSHGLSLISLGFNSSLRDNKELIKENKALKHKLESLQTRFNDLEENYKFMMRIINDARKMNADTEEEKPRLRIKMNSYNDLQAQK